MLLDDKIFSFISHKHPGDDYDSETTMPGLLSHLSPANFSIVFDCLMESHTVAYDFNSRFGLRSLIQIIVRLRAPANLLRQSTMAFKFYFQTLLEICRFHGEHVSVSSVKRILIGERKLSPDAESTLHEDSDAQLGDVKSAEWFVRRLHEACSQLSGVYNKLYTCFEFETLEKNLTSTPDSSPSKLRSHFGDDSLPIIRRKIDYPELVKGDTCSSPDRRQFEGKNNDDILQLRTWTALTVDMLETLLGLPTLQFKPILPAVYPALISMIPVCGDPKVCGLLYDIVARVSSLYGIM